MLSGLYLPCGWGEGHSRLFPSSLPCVRGGAAQRRWGCEVGRISRLRAAPASYQPLSRLPAPAPLTQGSRSLPSKRPRLSKSSRISRALPKSLPCGWGGAAQRWWGCGVCRISRLRAAPASYQPLSRLAAPAPLTQGSQSLPSKRPRLSGSSRFSWLFPSSLPCGWGGATQRRWGCEVCRVSCLRATPVSLQPLSRLPAPAPLTQGSRSLPQEPPLWLGRCRAAAVGL